jgi:alkylation response protein AidB-like acyl-CoA dehydrogenase
MRRTIFAAEHDDFRASVRGFLRREAVPQTEAWEAAGLVPRDYWLRAGAQGFVAFAAPEAYGGAGVDDFRFNAVIDEEVVRAGVAGDNFALVNDIVAPYLIDLGTDDQRARWLPGVVSGAIVPAIAMSEPGAGSDLRGIQAKAVWRGDHYELTASKTFVSSGIQADLVIVAAHVERQGIDGMGLFVVERGASGFERGRKLEKIGRRAQDTAELFFDAVPVPESHVLGEAGRGLSYLMRNLPQERLSIAVTAIASAERALELTVAYARERKAFGKPLGNLQSVRFTLAELATDIRIGRVYVDRCLDAHGAGELDAAEAAGAKQWATDLEFRTIDACLQLHGGYGYMEEYPIARMWRDCRVQRIYGGANEVMKEIVGRSLGL